MAIDYDAAMALENLGQPFSWSDREVMLYALGVGMGENPLDLDELAFVNEGYLDPRELKVLPTFATVAAWTASPGHIDLQRHLTVDGERMIEFHAPLPASADVLADSFVASIFDKGEDKGAVITRRTLLRALDGRLLTTIAASQFARGDGGFGGPSGTPNPHHPMPDRSPDHVITLKTRPGQALLYRLSGDRNPLHSDPAFARRAGFDRPIMHGMCTFGMACRAILRTYADFDPLAFVRMGVRFSAPVFPGESISFALWKDGDVVSFEAQVEARAVTVVRQGLAVLR
ncbi:MaoC family dehydratase N-terminal domain-containing protein [Stakelama sp. CBK3Z-3]|uniref:MaoC family dehydratase N-terminal domain-containing protein n=1 Tax=Stakelama flava TaxID=2860338 RepID=A0ABS6XPZ8_9SPHN|nr:MaoC family dehydratase [Stakelama flava]MBW4332320.1 MaoC family dehydratase N-terminal domain-containing protein [Stakelama flava]